MNRSLKLSVLVALALGSAPALALTLGQIQVKSALDRPLLAVIPLHPDHPGEADHIKVTLASAAAFANAGISRTDLKVPLTFKVVADAQGQKVIRVTSTEPVRRTYLDFLIQVSWPKGKLLREYTVLLDPLSMMPSAPAAAPAKVPPARTVASQPSTTQTQTESAQTPTRRPAAAPATPGHVYGPVPYGDTLSQIALDHAVSGVSYQQMLIALKSANPNAFYRNNVNALKAGAILRIPTRSQALTMTRQAAIAAVRQQNQSWQSQHAVAPTLVASAGGSSAPIIAAGKAASSGDRLHLVPPEAASNDPAGGGGGQAKAAELRQDLARSKEALSSQKQASADLQSRVTALQQIADKNKRLLGLKNTEIAELQQKLAAARKAAGLPALQAPAQAGVAATTSAGKTAAVPAMAVPAGSKASLAVASTAAGTGAVAVVAHPSHAATKPALANAAKPKPESATATHHAVSGSTPWYAQMWARIVLIIIILLLIAWMVMRRRKPSGKAPRKSLADDFGDSPLGPDADADADAAAGAADDTSPLEPFVDNDGEGELLAQLGEHPDNVGLHLELASLYFARRDASQFEGAAEAMHAYVDDESQPEWQDVVSMGRELVPDHPLFAQAAPAEFGDDGTAPMSPEEVMLEPEDQDDHDEARHVASTEGALEAHSVGYGLDFDLDPEPSHPHEPEAREISATQLPDESEFDALPPLPIEAEDMDEPEDAMDLDSDGSEPARPKPAPDLAATFGMDDPVDGFSDDPVDTKLDLARAYMDMGDHDGARAMLTEALNEGSRVQKDTAQKLLEDLA